MWRFLGVMTSLLLSGCNPSGGSNCRSVALGSRLDTYPHGELRQLTSGDAALATGLLAATPELQCCDPAAPQPCSSAACVAVVDRLRISELSGKYINEPCQSVMEGITLYCMAFVDESDRIVGVKTFCAD